MEHHIASAFDRDLADIQASIMKMGDLVERAIDDSAKALQDGDVDLAAEVRRRDKAIDALEEQVNADAARVIALRAPTASDLRTVLSVLRISANLERCGDYAKNVAKRVEVVSEAPPVKGASASLSRMSREVTAMMKDALDAYAKRDADLAADVILRDENVDEMYNSIFREFLTHMMEDPRNITPCMHLHFIAKNIERMGDHVTSVAEQVVYLVTGMMPEEARPKGDKTSFMDFEG